MKADTFIHKIDLPQHPEVSLFIYRLDQLHPILQGNKYFKLKYNLAHAKKEKLPIITIGGAFSNHLHASAVAGKHHKITTYGIVRGKHFKFESPTLIEAKQNGMQILFTDRNLFAQLRTNPDEELLKEIFNENKLSFPSNYHFIPEGGSNELGIKGAREILPDNFQEIDVFCLPVGSGGTISGLIQALDGQKELLGFAAANDTSLSSTIEKWTNSQYSNWSINSNYHFGGFAKWNKELIDFINSFNSQYHIPLDPVYTGKMLYGLIDLIKQNKWSKPISILAFHTGGLQGIKGFNMMNKNLLMV